MKLFEMFGKKKVNEAILGRQKPLQKALIVYPNMTFDTRQAVQLPVGTSVEFAQGGDDYRNNIAKIVASVNGEPNTWFTWNDSYHEALSSRIKEDDEQKTWNTLKGENGYDVYVRWNFWGGKYYEDGFRPIRVLATSPEEAKQFVIGNLDTVEDHFRKMRIRRGAKSVPAVRNKETLKLTPRAIGKVTPTGLHRGKIMNRQGEMVDFNRDDYSAVENTDIGEKLGEVTEGIVDTLGRKMGVKVTHGAPKANQAPQWATHVGQTPEGAYHWLSNETPVQTDDSDRYFPLASRTEFTGYTGHRNKNGVVEPIAMLGEGDDSVVENTDTDIKSKDPKVSQMLKKARIKYAGQADDDLSALVSMMGDEQDTQDNELNSLDRHNNTQDIDIGQEEHTNNDQEAEIDALDARVSKLERGTQTESINEAEHSEAVTQVLMRLRAAGGKVYDKAFLQKGDETAMLAQNGNIRFAIFQDGKVKRAKKFIEFQRDGWEIEMNLGEDIVPCTQADGNSKTGEEDVTEASYDNGIDFEPQDDFKNVKGVNFTDRDQNVAHQGNITKEENAKLNKAWVMLLSKMKNLEPAQRKILRPKLQQIANVASKRRLKLTPSAEQVFNL